jgi:hypothetical protein
MKFLEMRILLCLKNGYEYTAENPGWLYIFGIERLPLSKRAFVALLSREQLIWIWQTLEKECRRVAVAYRLIGLSLAASHRRCDTRRPAIMEMRTGNRSNL